MSHHVDINKRNYKKDTNRDYGVKKYSNKYKLHYKGSEID